MAKSGITVQYIGQSHEPRRDCRLYESRAARLLGMPKTTVSAKMAALERRLGVNLIRSTTRKLFVTEAGEAYFRHCANAMREVEMGEAALLSAKNVPSGLLRVTAPVDIGHAVLPRIARAYLDRYPGTRIEMIISNRIVDLVGEGIDLAIRAATLKDSSLVARRFMRVDAGLWASPAYLAEHGTPSHPRELSHFRIVAYRGMKTLHLSKGTKELQLPISGRVTADDLETIRGLLIHEEGIGWLPYFLAEEAEASGLLVRVLPQWKSKPEEGIHFVYPGQKYATPNVQAFISTALDILHAA
ncbi:MAG: LysR family transcriptional regulator [Burkholderiaceae bacterium]